MQIMNELKVFSIPQSDLRKVEVNVGGRVFRTTVQTLLKHPGTTLTNTVIKENISASSSDLELYFDSNPDVFASIIDYYRTGHLHIPRFVCSRIMRDELSFWKIGEDKILPCCWGHLYSVMDNEQVKQEKKDLKHSRNKIFEEKWPLRWKIWQFLDKPRSSRAAKVWHIFYLFLLISLFLASCLESSPTFRTSISHERKLEIDRIFNFTNPNARLFFTSTPYVFITVYGRVCQLIFTLEFIVRFIVCFDKRKFFKCILNIIDLIAIPAIWATFVMENIRGIFHNPDYLTTYSLLRSLSVIRLLRIFRLAKQFTDLKILLLSVKSSHRELLLLVTVLAIFACIFAKIVHAVEITHHESFPDIFISLWWSIITMTTVGYGDTVPKTAIGKIIGSVCAMCGLLVVSMPVAVISRNFGERYCYHKSKKQRTAWIESNRPRKE